MSNIHVKYESLVSHSSQVMPKVKVLKVCQSSRSRSLGTKLWHVCMYVCMPVISSYLGAPCPTPRGDRTGTNEPHYRSGEGGSEAFTVWINVRFPLNICTGEGPAFGMRPATKDPCEIPDTPSPKSQRPAGGP